MSPPASERAERIASHVHVTHTLRSSYGAQTAQRAVHGVWTFEQARAARGQRPHSYQPRATPWEKERIFIEGQRPVSYLNFKILITPCPNRSAKSNSRNVTCGIDNGGRATRVTAGQ